ncbi:cytochrome P450 4C1 [Fopius arisanus]|uniref:CYP4C1_6 protein n=1 Tax=Fopius arisanus TaxID=64838 RepID=A0A0C9RFM1_9HYME|nr:PREDICTED: cytochrome P450 4C1-like [Fopius arisanus]
MAVALLLIKTIGVLGLFSLLVFYLKKIRLYRAAAKFPGPPALPFIGNAHAFVGSTEDILKKTTELYDMYPSPLRFWLGSRLFFGVCEPEQLKIVFTSPKTIEKEDLYKFARPWLGTGLFTAPASKWRVHRKLILPTFNPRILESFVEVFAQQSDIMVRQMKVEIDGDEFDVFNYISLCTLDIICETAMGVTMKAQTEGDPTYVESAKKIFEIFYTRMFKVWLHPDIIFNNTQLGKDQRKCIEYLHGLTNDVIKKKKQEMESGHQIIENTKPRKAFLDFLMELSHEGTKFTDEELREEVDTMMIAGNDTTASVNAFVMLMLGNFPDVQERCYQELVTIYGDNINNETTITHEDLHKMEYLERTIKETLRLFPVGPVLVRHVSEDLDIGDQVLPRDSSVVIGILKMHRNEKYWPEPLKFDPDRFLPEEVAKRHPYSFVPFSAGPRNCIGVRYAMMAMKTLIATVLRHYVIKKDRIVEIEDIKLKADVMLKPVEPISVKIERRKS